jgi:hypothetical protein
LKGGKKGMRRQVLLGLTLVRFQRSIENGHKVRMGGRRGGAGGHDGSWRRDTMGPSISSRPSTAHDWQKTRGLTRGNQLATSAETLRRFQGPGVAIAIHLRLSFSLSSPDQFPDHLNSNSAHNNLRMRDGKIAFDRFGAGI